MAVPVSFSLRHLLAACLSEYPEEFSVHLRSWEELQDLQEIDAASAGLIPFLYRRAEAFGVQMRNHDLCKGMYLKSWYKYQLRSALPRELLLNNPRLKGAVLLKGAALQQSIYAFDPPTRPADDVDVLIPRESALITLKLMLGDGYQMDNTLSPETLVNLRNSVNLHRGREHLDIHWSIFPVCLDPGFSARLSARAKTGIDGLFYTSPADSLLHTLVHGFGLNEVNPLRWVLDAALLIRSGEVDWNIFNTEARATGWSSVLQYQINLLNSEFEVPVSKEIQLAEQKGYVIGIARMYLSTKNTWIRRFLRVIGWDLAVFSQNQGARPTLFRALVFFPKWVAIFLREFKEVVMATNFQYQTLKG
jgi:hypothetical protein